MLHSLENRFGAHAVITPRMYRLLDRAGYSLLLLLVGFSLGFWSRHETRTPIQKFQDQAQLRAAQLLAETDHAKRQKAITEATAALHRITSDNSGAESR